MPNEKFLTFKAFVGAMPKMAEAVREHVAAEIEPLEARVAQLEQRNAVLEAKVAAAPAISYCGVWQEGREYQRGQFVTDHGCMWACREPTTKRPGASSDWQLAVKRGANGKDAP